MAVLCAYHRFHDGSGRRAYFFREFLSRDGDAGEIAAPPVATKGIACGHDEALGRGPAAERELLLGDWQNTHRGTLGIPRLRLEAGGEGVAVRVWGTGADGPIDWGEVRGEVFTCVEEDDVRSAAVLARYDFDFMECELQIRQNKGVLAVTSFNRFRDGSGRSDYVTRELYHRDPEEGA